MPFEQLQEKILDKDLCMICGGCELVCPKNIIQIDQKVSLLSGNNSSDCLDCNLCVDVCPGYDTAVLNSETNLFGKSRTDEERWIGIYSSLFSTTSLKEDIYNKSSSGGSASSIICSAFEYLQLDFFLVTGRDFEKPYVASPHILRDITNITNHTQSTYQLFNLLGVLKKEIIKNPKQKFGVIGLACHIQAVRKIQNTDTYIGNILKENMLIVLEVACSSNTLLDGTISLIQSKNVELSEVENIKYRDGEYPGNFTIYLKDGNLIAIPFWESVIHFKNYKSFRCLSCPDWMSGLSDISFCDGDPNIFETSKTNGEATKSGISIIRTKNGKKVFDYALKNKFIKADEKMNFWNVFNLGLERKINRRISYDNQSKTVPLAPIPNYKTNGDSISDDLFLK